MTRSARTATRAELDLRVFFELIRARSCTVFRRGGGCLDLGRQVVLDMVRLLHERQHTLARLRRLFGSARPRSSAPCFPAGQASQRRGFADHRRRSDDPRRGRSATTAATLVIRVDGDGATATVAVPPPAPEVHDGRAEPREALARHARARDTVGSPPPRIAMHRARTSSTIARTSATRARSVRTARSTGFASPSASCAHRPATARRAHLGTRSVALQRLRRRVHRACTAEAQGSKYDERAAAIMALLRYRVGTPLHRLDRLQRNLETPVPASTQWEVVRDHVDAVVPVHDELGRRAASGRLLHNDRHVGPDPRVHGQAPRPNSSRTASCRIRTAPACSDRLRLDHGRRPIALFFSGRKHAGENFTSLLAARDPGLPPPIHMCDGLDRNRPARHAVIEDNCLAHGRRHIVDEADNFPAECRHVLEALGKVFKTDEQCKEQALSDDERLAVHQRDSAPVMVELQRWMHAELDEKRVEPNSGLGDAFDYLLKRWDKLTLFLRVPGAPLDNNICERALKMAIRHRNNSLFYRSQRGARVGDIYMALIYTPSCTARTRSSTSSRCSSIPPTSPPIRPRGCRGRFTPARARVPRGRVTPGSLRRVAPTCASAINALAIHVLTWRLTTAGRRAVCLVMAARSAPRGKRARRDTRVAPRGVRRGDLVGQRARPLPRVSGLAASSRIGAGRTRNTRGWTSPAPMRLRSLLTRVFRVLPAPIA